MGATAARLADHVIVTSDNPRSEEPSRIISQVLDGIPGREAESFEDRQVAIFSAIHHARVGDVVLLAGKGHETYQEIAGTRVPFSDREAARAALEEWDGGPATPSARGRS
jgi:UDP-N-acetylmuramyl tripeptide synthase